MLISLGNELGCDVWVAPNDRRQSFEGKRFSDLTLESLPNLGFWESAKKTIENIDVIWLEENAPACAFEIEVTTSIYSGLLRLSDLVASAKRMDFPIYIVARRERGKEVKDQLTRPTFKSIGLSKKCKFISIEELEENYDNIRKFAKGPDVIDKIAKTIDQL